MPTVTVPAGTVSYRVAGPDDSAAPPVVFVHGFLVDSTLWDGVAERLAAIGIRSYLVDWPLGSHRDGDVRRRRPLAARCGAHRRRRPRRALARRCDARRQRHRRGDLPAPVGRRPEPHRTGGVDQLRRLRELPAAVLPAVVPRGQANLAHPHPLGPDAPPGAASLAARLRDAAAQAARRRAHARVGGAGDGRRRHPPRHRPLRPPLDRRALLDATPRLGEFDRPVCVVWGAPTATSRWRLRGG